MVKLLAFGAISLMLVGCVSPEVRRAALEKQNNEKCLAYGAKPGTDGYLSCRLALDKMASDQKAALLSSDDPKTCNRSGNTVICY